jgi:hypothetical protein
VFYPPDMVEDRLDFMFNPTTYNALHCPECGGEDFEPAYRCECDRVVPESKFNFICDECQEKTEEAFTTFLNALTDKQLEYLDWRTDGVSLVDILKNSMEV